MAIEFHVIPHSIKGNTGIVEILVDEKVAAVLYPDGEKGLKLVSAHFKDIVQDDGTTNNPPIPAILITLDPQPYMIKDGKIVKLLKSNQ